MITVYKRTTGYSDQEAARDATTTYASEVNYDSRK
jgi:hypothetical protein